MVANFVMGRLREASVRAGMSPVFPCLQERYPIAADIKRILREKSRASLRTFALTADVAEAHRQVPIDRRDWHLLGSQIRPDGQYTSILSAPSGWPQHPITGQE